MRVIKIVIKIIEVIGTSELSWEDAAKNAVENASKSIRGITGVDIIKQTAKVQDNKIVKYKATCKLAFSVED